MRIDRFKPYLFQFIGGVGPQIIGIFISSVIVRSAGIDGFGKYTLFLGLISVVFGVIGTALDTYYQRSCQVSYSGEIFSTKILVWLLVSPLIIIGSYLIRVDAAALVILMLGVLFQQLVETRVVRDRIQGRDFNAILPRLVPVCLFAIVIFFNRPSTVVDISIIFTFAWINSLFFVYPLIRSASLSITHSIGLLKSVSPIWISLLLTQAYGNIDLYIIRLFHSDAEVGVYKIGYIFASILMPLIGVISFIFLSKISAAIREKKITLAKSIFKNQKYLTFALCVGVLVFSIFFFPWIANNLYGETGRQAIQANRILAVAMIFNMLSLIYVYMLLALGKERLIAFMTIIATAVYLILTCMLVPIFSINGAATAMCFTNFFLLFAYRFLCDREFHALES